MDGHNRTTALKPPAYGYELAEDGAVWLCRYKPPCWRLRLEPGEEGEGKRLAASLKKAAEWLVKKNR